MASEIEDKKNNEEAAQSSEDSGCGEKAGDEQQSPPTKEDGEEKKTSQDDHQLASQEKVDQKSANENKDSLSPNEVHEGSKNPDSTPKEQSIIVEPAITTATRKQETSSTIEEKLQSSLPPDLSIENNTGIYKLRELCIKLNENSSQQQQQSIDETTSNENIKITDSMLQLLVTDDLSSIRDNEVLKAFFIEHLRDLPPKIISEILSVLIAIVKKSVFHLESAQGLLPSCIDYLINDLSSYKQQQSSNQLSSTASNNNNQVVATDGSNKIFSASDSSIGLTKHFLREWINLLIAHSCDVEELKSILKLSELDSSLLNFMQQANLKQRHRPHAFFAFPGTKGSVMSLPPFQKWPIQLGWSFSTWFFLEPKACAQPYLYNFKTGKSGLGFSAHFTGNCLVLTSIRVKGKGVQHCVAYEFPSYKWTHCAIAYHNKWRASEIKVYVNGQLTANIEMPWQVQTNEMFDKCFIGGSGSITSKDRGGDLNCFSGQLSALYLFNEGLSAAQICALHRLGPSYMGQFKYSNEIHVNLPPQICKTLYEEKLASSLFCLFTPVAVDSGTLCIQMAPFKSSTSASAQNYFLSAPHAALFGQTKAIITQPICSTLQSLGCSRSLLPLLDVFASEGNATACASLVGFLCDLLESSPHWFANEIVQNNGFVVVACALSTNSKVLLSDQLLEIFLNLTRTLLTTSITAGDSLLLKHLMDNILFNPSLWIYANTELQIKLYSYLASEFLHGTRHSNKYMVSSSATTNIQPYIAYTPTSSAILAQQDHSSDDQQGAAQRGYYGDNNNLISDLLFGEIRRVSTVLQSLHALKYYYWIAEEKNINQKARNYNLRPNQEQLISIRAHILSFTKELILRAPSVPLDEIQGLLNYLSACNQPENLTDALDMLTELITEHPVTTIEALDQKQAIRVLFTLVGSKSEPIRIKSLQLMSLFLSHCSHKRKQDIMGPNNLFMLLCERLRLYRPMTLELYEALIDLMVEETNPNSRALDENRPSELSKKRIENSMIVKVIASLLRDERAARTRSASVASTSATTSCHSMEHHRDLVDMRKIFINDLWNLIVNSRDNRRIILQMSVWQHWLINLIDSTIDDSPLVRDQVLAIFRVLLYHALRYEYGGWRVWIDTLAIIHSKVSYDEFCAQLNRDACQDQQESKQPPTAAATKNKESTKPTANSNDQSKCPDVSPQQKQVSGQDEAAQHDELEQKTTIVSSISERVPNESRGIEMSSDHGSDVPDAQDRDKSVQQQDESEKKQAKSPASSVENEPETASTENVSTSPTMKEIEEGMDSVDLAPSRAYRRNSIADNQSGENGDSQQQQQQQTSEANGITRQPSMTSIPLEESSSTCNEIAQESDSKNNGDDDDKQPDDDLVEANKYEEADCSSAGPHSIQSQKATASPAFRIPEFKWTGILVKLLNDLMFSIECDLYQWRCIAKLDSLDTLPFVAKSLTTNANSASSAHTGLTISARNSGATSSAATNQMDGVLQRPENQIYIVNVVHLVCQLADNVIIAGGGLLPLLADATGGPRTSSSSSGAAAGANEQAKSSTPTYEGLTMGQANSLIYRLINMVDVVIFAAAHLNLQELEADKNTTSGGILRQCLRLACTVTVKNCLVLRNLNSKISSLDVGGNGWNLNNCELPNDMFDSYHGCSFLSANGLFENSALILNNTDLIADLEYSPHQTPNTSSMPSTLPFQTNPIKDPNKLLQSIDISRIQMCIYYDNSSESRQSQFLALSSLYFISVLMVSKYRDIIEPKHKSHRTKSVSSSQGSPAPSLRSDSSPIGGEPQQQHHQHQQAAPVSSIEANLLNFGKMQPNHPNTNTTTANTSTSATSSANALTNMLTSKLESTLDTVCPLLKSIMCDFCAFLSRTLVGSHGQELVNKEAERTFRRGNSSPVELVMLLCSQEWQNTLQKNAGLAFIELINEGRVLSHGMKDHIVRVAMEAEFILSRLRADDVAKHEHFGLACSESLSARLHEEVLINSLISSAARRDFMLYCKFKEMIQNENKKNYKLDIWEDDDRRKRRFVFDSWSDSSQTFYSPQISQEETQGGGESAAATAAATTSATSVGDSETMADDLDREKTDTKRILELQKTIELSGIDDHCSPEGVVDQQTNQVDAMSETQDDEHDESEDELADDGCDQDSNLRSPSSNEPGYDLQQANQRSLRTDSAAHRHSNTDRLHEAVNQQSSFGNKTNNGASRETNNNSIGDQLGGATHHHQSSHQLWDNDDCGSTTDFTGSVICAAECSLIWSIYAIPGLLQITTHEVYFEPNQNVGELIDSLKRESQSEAATKQIAEQQDENCLKSLRSNGSECHSSSEHISLRKIDLKALRYCDFLACNGKFSLNDIRAIFSRHYLLQPNALEIFLTHRTSVMFAFADFDTVKRVVKYLPSVGVGIKYGIAQSRRASLMSPRQLFAASNMTQKWQKREIGNYQYLMFLNTIAGRTYQDLNQYPVFPWILTNYESDELDVNLPSNFRDLSKPVGALNNKRRSEFIERYQSWDNPKVPAFHYGTHYSTAAFTLNWLCRLRGTNNSSYLALQDGHYEEDSRLFLSIGDSWVSSLVGGNQNVKELIPEFFYLPEMFHTNLGLPEVELPPWAKSAEDFVRIHRMALESELVSCQLHQWIDLIFGYKQRGPEAVNSVNTFYYLTYQGNVNLNMIQDQSLREAIETQIKHFGQTPSQLTNEPHPPRFSALHSSPLMFSPSTDEVSKVIKFPFNNPIIHISSCINNYIAPTVSIADGSLNGGGGGGGSAQNQPNPNGLSSILTITSNNQYQIHKWISNNTNSGHPFVIDPQLESQSAGSSSRRQLIDVDDLCPGVTLKLSNYGPGTINEVQLPCTHHIVTLNGKYIIMGSFYDNSFRVFSTENGKLCQVIYGHRGPITCLTRGEGNAAADFFIATGSQDCSLLIWTWNERFAQVEGSGVSAVHNPLPKLSICGHQTPVLSANICAELGLVISGSKNLILVHTTTIGENLLHIDINLPAIMDRTISENKLHTTDSSMIQRPRVQDKQRTILEASMLGDDTQSLESSTFKSTLAKKSASANDGQMSNVFETDEKFSQLKDLCCSDYYITNLQLARELAFIVCVALPPPRKKSRSSFDETMGSKSSPALLLTFNLKGSLMDSRPIGQAISCPKLGDYCALQTSRDGEHLILNDSPITIKIYRTFDLQPLYAYNTNDIPNSLSEDQNRIRSLMLWDRKYILVGLENGKIIVYNSDFKNLQ